MADSNKTPPSDESDVNNKTSSPDKIRDVNNKTSSPDKISDVNNKTSSPDKISDVNNKTSSPDKISDVNNKTSSRDSVQGGPVEEIQMATSGIDEVPMATSAIDEVPMETSNNEVQTLCTSWHDQHYRSKFMYSVYITVSFCMLGFCIGQRGPTFLDLQIITDTDLKRASAFFTAGSIGYLLGSLVGGIIYEKVNKILLMFTVTLGMGICTGILPFCSPYGLMITIHCVSGLFFGGLDTCGNAELVRTWGSSGRSIMQTAHFAFAFGGVISPLISSPFLAPLPEEDVNATSTLFIESITATPNYSTSLPGGIISNVTATPNYTMSSPSTTEETQTTKVFYAFLIVAVTTVISSVPFLITYFKVRSQMKKRTPGPEENQSKHDFSLAVFLFTLALICSMYMLYCCVEDTFAAYLLTFVVKSQHWSKSKATMLTSVFWASFAFGRFSGIFFVKFISSVKLLFICCVSLIIAQIGFLISAHFHAPIGIWVCSVITGLSMSVFFPTGLTWTEEELVKMSGRVSSAILISASSGTMINPILLGFLMEAFDLMWYAYLLTLESILCMILFLILLIFARTYLKKRKRSADITKEVIVNGTPIPADQKFI